MLRAMIGFEHLPKTMSPVVGGALQPWSAYLGYTGSVTNPTLAAVDQDGWLGAYSTTAVNVAFDMTGIVPANPSKVTFGFRIKNLQAYTSSHSIFHLAEASAPNGIATYPFLSNSTSTPWLTTLGAEAYVEVTYDFVAFSCEVRVNGVLQSTTTQGTQPTAAQKTAFTNGTWSFNFALSNAVGVRYAIRDIYVLDVVAGDGMTLPLGPQRMFPVYPDSAVGAGWTSNNGAPLVETLNVALPTAVAINSPADHTPLNVSFNTTAPAGSVINAVSLMLSGTSLGDNPTVSKCELTQAGTTTSPIYISTPKTIKYGSPLGLLSKAPNGTAWDVSKIDTLTLKITPDTPA